MAGGFGLDDFFIPTDGTLRIYNKAGTNYNQLGVSPDAIGKISVDGITLTTNSEGAIAINLANANTWTAAQTFPVATFANLLSTANTWTALQTFNAGITTNEITATTINSAAAQTTITGTTAGTIIASMPEQGSSYKKAILYANGYENDTTTAQSWTFPVAFTNIPLIIGNSTGLSVSTSTTAVTIAAPDNTTVYSGWIIIEGY